MAVLLMAFAGSSTWRCSSWLLCAGDGELLINYGILTIWSVTRASFLGGLVSRFSLLGRCSRGDFQAFVLVAGPSPTRSSTSMRGPAVNDYGMFVLRWGLAGRLRDLRSLCGPLAIASAFDLYARGTLRRLPVPRTLAGWAASPPSASMRAAETWSSSASSLQGRVPLVCRQPMRLAAPF